jgi:hypothetical protein
LKRSMSAVMDFYPIKRNAIVSCSHLKNNSPMALSIGLYLT